MPLRSVNDPVDAAGVLAALGAVMVQNTQFLASGGQFYINTWAALDQGTAPFPALVLESGPQTTTRLGWRVWQNSLLARCVYIDRWDSQALTIDQIWAKLDADLHRMKSNIEDNPTLTVGGVPHALHATKIELTPYIGQKDDRMAVSVVKRGMQTMLHLPLYSSVG